MKTAQQTDSSRQFRFLERVPSAPLSINAQPRRLAPDPGHIEHALACARWQTPLRYPGAKTGLSRQIGQLVAAAAAHPIIGSVELLVEPFAGGASTSLRLVGAGIVNRVLLADADPLVAAFWQVAASDTEHLIDRITDEHRRWLCGDPARGVRRWDYWRAWVPKTGASKEVSRFEAAVKCLFLNRTTFSGILHGTAGPIGGRRQASEYAIGCRFDPDVLAARLRYVGHLYETGRLVDVWCKDWAATLADVCEWYPGLLPNHVVAYLDPPYLEKSSSLYQTSFDPHGGYAAAPVNDLHWADLFMHLRLAEHLRRRMQYRWILSYDNHPSLLNDPALYSADRMTPTVSEKVLSGIKEWRISKRIVPLRYTAAARKRSGISSELLLTTLPPSIVPLGDQWQTV